MSDESRKLQAAVFSALNGNLTDEQSPANNVPVYDNVPENSAPTYVEIGDGTQTNDDTKDGDGVEHELVLDIYSSYRGRQRTLFVMDQIKALLNRASLSASGYQVSPPIFTFSTVFREPDGIRGVMRFTIRTYPE